MSTTRADPAARLFPVGLAALALVFAADSAIACEPGKIEIRTDGGSETFLIEIADEPAEMARGLMFRTALPADAGMLFVFDQPRRANFWMHNTMIPLDMIFIDATGRVESIAERMDTFSDRTSASAGDVRAVLEINGGLSAKLGIGPGAQAVHPTFDQAPEDARCAN